MPQFTAEERLPRMERLVERMAECDRTYGPAKGNEHYDDARTIQAMRADPDDEIAQQICDRAGIWSTTARDAVKAGIQYGRAAGQFEAQQPL